METIETIIVLTCWFGVFVAPVALVLGCVYFVVTWPFRYLERARFLIDVVAAAVADGRSPERTFIDLSRRHERAFGPKLHLLAAHLERGLTLAQGLEKVPKLVPPAVATMLRVGEEIRDMGKVLPAARRLLSDEMSHAREAQYHAVALATATSLMGALMIAMLGTTVFPKFDAIMADMDEGRGLIGWMLYSVFSPDRIGTWVVGVLAWIALMWGWMLLCVGGIERFVWTQMQSPRLAALIWHWLPWRYKRLQRDFSYMLALLLDAHVPEARAVAMAATGTANPGIEQRAWHVVQDLQAGVWLPGAIQHLDDKGQLEWRIQHATFGQRSFSQALLGWQESLDTDAAKEERVAIELTNLAVVLLNGLLVALVTISVFQFLTQMTDLTQPW